MLLSILILSCFVVTAPSPMEDFLSARAVRCALASGDWHAGWHTGWRAGWGTRRQVKPHFSSVLSVQDNLKHHAPNYHIGPTKGPLYDPNYGYEPYWADGGWVFHKSQNSTPEPDDYCGNVCAPSYIEYGEICARNQDAVYKTFKNYCAMKASDCTDEERWKIVYKGACIDSGDKNKGQNKGGPRHISVKYTLAKPQPKIRKDIVQAFYDLYNLPIGGSLHNGTTKTWNYTETYTDY